MTFARDLRPAGKPKKPLYQSKDPGEISCPGAVEAAMLTQPEYLSRESQSSWLQLASTTLKGSPWVIDHIRAETGFDSFFSLSPFPFCSLFVSPFVPEV